MKKFIYNSAKFIEYFKSKGYTYENYPSRLNKRGTIFPLLQPPIENPVVFYPYYGEFGRAIARHIVWFHYLPAKYKIACVPKGYECFFPSANEVIHDYRGPKWNEYKREWLGIDVATNTYRGWDAKPQKGTYMKLKRHFQWKLDINSPIRHEFKKSISKIHPNATYFDAPDYHPVDPYFGIPTIPLMKIPFNNPNKYGIKVDVVFSNRKFEKDKRSFQKWPEIIKHLQSKGLSVGGIGMKDIMFDVGNIPHNCDYDNPNEAMIEMFSNAKYYIGTDTGSTHVGLNFTHLKSLLFRARDDSPNWIKMHQTENTRYVKEMSKSLYKFNDEKILIKHIDEFFA